MGLDLFIEKVSRKELAYFRKVNFLIPFFENYFNTKLENLKDLEITRESIEELKNRCESILKDHTLAKDLLPTKSGFFFGNTDYDDDYYGKVKLTLQYCEAILVQFNCIKEDETIVFNFWY
jgi:hypothetical protein